MLFAPDEIGQGLVEYGLILLLIAIMLIASFGLLKDAIISVYTQIVAKL